MATKLSLDIDGYKFSESLATPSAKIYINNVELITTKKPSVDLEVFTGLYEEYKNNGTPSSKFVTLTGRLDNPSIGFIADPHKTPTDSYAVRIQLQIIKNPTTLSPTDEIAKNEAVIIEFGPYKIATLPKLGSGGGRRRTKISKRHSTYRTRKNKK